MGLVVDCYSIGDIPGEYTVGGLIGSNRDGGTVVNCYAIGDVRGALWLGGLVGSNHFECTITKCYSKGSVAGSGWMGGLAGDNDGNIVNCYSASTVEGNYSLGGLVGDNGGNITECYSLGSVVGVGVEIGGLAGNDVHCEWDPFGGGHWNCYYGETVDSFWDTESSGQASSTGGEGKTTSQLHQQSTFTDWDFINV